MNGISRVLCSYAALDNKSEPYKFALVAWDIPGNSDHAVKLFTEPADVLDQLLKWFPRGWGNPALQEHGAYVCPVLIGADIALLIDWLLWQTVRTRQIFPYGLYARRHAIDVANFLPHRRWHEDAEEDIAETEVILGNLGWLAPDGMW